MITFTLSSSILTYYYDFSYHKFIRGKDLSRYSADDISCVLGSKRSRILAEEETKSEIKDESSIGDKEHINGVTVIKGGTIQVLIHTVHSHRPTLP